jgi:hypothetical protein
MVWLVSPCGGEMRERSCRGRGEREDAMPWWGVFREYLVNSERRTVARYLSKLC